MFLTSVSFFVIKHDMLKLKFGLINCSGFIKTENIS